MGEGWSAGFEYGSASLEHPRQRPGWGCLVVPAALSSSTLWDSRAARSRQAQGPSSGAVTRGWHSAWRPKEAAPYFAALCLRHPAWALLARGGAISEGKSASPGLGRGTEREA